MARGAADWNKGVPVGVCSGGNRVYSKGGFVEYRKKTVRFWVPVSHLTKHGSTANIQGVFGGLWKSRFLGIHHLVIRIRRISPQASRLPIPHKNSPT